MHACSMMPELSAWDTTLC